jgi:DNA polymerase-3 subunit alpha
LRGKFDLPSYRKEYEFVLNQVELLHELKEKNAHSIDLRVATKNVNQLLISDLNKLFVENPGSCQVKFIVHDPLDGIEISMPSKNIRVDVNNNFIRELKKYDLEFSLKGR